LGLRKSFEQSKHGALSAAQREAADIVQREGRRLEVKNVKKKTTEQQERLRERGDGVVELEEEEKKVKKTRELWSFYRLPLLPSGCSPT
jgi:TRAP-type C4-dicarboxylate transport system substrate-binding protein